MDDEIKKSHRVRNIIVVAVVLVGGGLLMVNRLQSSPGQTALEDTAVYASTLPVTLPFEFVAGHIVVDAVLADGTDPVALILDTGAPTILSDEIAEQIGAAVVGNRQFATIDGTVISNDIMKVPELRLGDATFTDVGSIKGFLEPDNPLSCISSNGIIGASLMKEAVWQIDYGTNRVTIAPSVAGLDHIEDAITLEFTAEDPSSPSPILSFPSGDAALTFLVDTGSDGSLIVNPDDLAAIGSEIDPSAPAVTLVGSGAAGSFDARLLYATVDLEIGSQQLDDFPLATLTSMSAGQGNMGNAFLANYVVTIDWSQNTIYLDPINDDPRPPLPPAVTLGWDGKRVNVGSFVEGSDAADLTTGQPISSVDGEDVSAATRDDFCELSVAKGPGDQYTITVDGGQTYQVAPVDDFFGPLSQD